jgi:hypothetical protein
VTWGRTSSPKPGTRGTSKRGGLGVGGVGYVDPQVALYFFDLVVPQVKTAEIHLLVGHQRWNFGALAVFVEAPAMVAALDLGAVEAAAAEGHRPVGANIANGKGFALVGAAKQDGLVEQSFGYHLAPLQLAAGHGVVPNIAQQVDVVNSNHRSLGRLRIEGD